MSRRVHHALRQFAEFLLAHPILVFGSLVASALVAAAVSRNVKFDFTPQSIYRGNDALLAYAEEFKQTFGYDEAVMLAVVVAEGEQDTLTAPVLQWQIDVSEALKPCFGVIRTESVGTLQVPSFSVRGLSLRPLIDQQEVNDAGAQRARSTLADSRMARGGLLSEDDRVSAIAIFLDPTVMDIDSMQRVVREVRTVLDKHPVPSGYSSFLSGLPELRVEVVNDLMRDMATLMPLGGIVYLIVLSLLFRRLSGAFLPLCAVGIGLSWTMATFAITGDTLNLVSNILPILLMIIGVSSCVQIVTCYAEQSAKGLDRREAAREAIAEMTAPCFLAAVTTAVGFASLFTARSELLSRFGGQAAIGVAFQFFSTLLTLGALFRFFPAPTYVALNETKPGFTTRVVTLLGYWVARHPWTMLTSAALIVLMAAWSGSRVEINTYAVRETFFEDHPSMKGMRIIENKLSGLMPLEVSLTAREPGLFLTPEVFQRISEAEREIGALPNVLVTQSYVDLFREILRSWPGRRRDETDAELVPLSDVGENRLNRTVEFVNRFPETFHFRSFVSQDGKRARIRVRLREIGSRETLELVETVQQKLLKSFPADGPIRADLTGEAFVNAKALTILVRDLFYALLTASLVIFTLIAIEFRSLRIGLISAIPNLTPLTITLGYMGLRGYEMNVANVIAFTICLGLADDNTIHFLYRFRQEMETADTPAHAVRQAFLGTGRAIVLTSVLLLIGMSVLLVSDFVPTKRFAELTSITIIGNLLGVLLLLPACLVLFWKKTAKPMPSTERPDNSIE